MFKSRKVLIIIAVLLVTIISAFWLTMRRVGNETQIKDNYSHVKADVSLNGTNNEVIADLDNLNEKNEAKDEDDDISFLFFGDIMLDRNVGAILKEKSVTELLSGLITENTNVFLNKDIISANLEGAVTNNGDHYLPANLYDFAFSVENVKELQNYGFNYLALANNHFLDQGEKGVNETRENLENANYYFSGSPDSKINDFSKVNIEIDSKTITMISLSMVYNNFDKDKAIELVSLSKEKADYVIVNIHWGNEYEHYYNNYQQNVGRYLIDAGADLIVGHHPHVVQGMEVYKERPIFYSLGNFIFDQYFSQSTQEGLALSISINEEKIAISFLPFLSTRSQPTFMEEGLKKDFLEKYYKWSDLDDQYRDNILDGYLEINNNK